jgi:hypothetical protein
MGSSCVNVRFQSACCKGQDVQTGPLSLCWLWRRPSRLAGVQEALPPASQPAVALTAMPAAGSLTCLANVFTLFDHDVNLDGERILEYPAPKIARHRLVDSAQNIGRRPPRRPIRIQPCRSDLLAVNYARAPVLLVRRLTTRRMLLENLSIFAIPRRRCVQFVYVRSVQGPGIT